MLLASLSGVISSDLTFDSANDWCQFSIKGETGVFFIRAIGLEQKRICRMMRRGDPIYIIGRPHSFKSGKCQNYHVYFEALALIPTAEGDKPFRQLLEQVHTATVFAKETRRPKG